MLQSGYPNFPIPILVDSPHGIRLPVPPVEISDQRQGVRSGRPFPVDPGISLLMESIVQISIREGTDLLFLAQEPFFGLPIQAPSQLDIAREISQVGIPF